MSTETLSDGRRFRIVKVFWTSPELTERLEQLGWQAPLAQKEPFYWGSARPT